MVSFLNDLTEYTSSYIIPVYLFLITFTMYTNNFAPFKAGAPTTPEVLYPKAQYPRLVYTMRTGDRNHIINKKIVDMFFNLLDYVDENIPKEYEQQDKRTRKYHRYFYLPLADNKLRTFSFSMNSQRLLITEVTYDDDLNQIRKSRGEYPFLKRPYKYVKNLDQFQYVGDPDTSLDALCWFKDEDICDVILDVDDGSILPVTPTTLAISQTFSHRLLALKDESPLGLKNSEVTADLKLKYNWKKNKVVKTK